MEIDQRSTVTAGFAELTEPAIADMLSELVSENALLSALTGDLFSHTADFSV
jgi:hypothetical protein